MKNGAILFFVILCLGVGSLYLLKGNEKVIKVTPFVNKLPEGSPYISLKVTEQMREKGVRFEWTLMQEQPKKRDYLKNT